MPLYGTKYFSLIWLLISNAIVSFFGGGYEVNEHVSFQSGYVHQFDYMINDETGRDFLQISVLLTFNVKKNKQKFLPSVSD